MGPQAFARGSEPMLCRQPIGLPCFNGAAGFRPRKSKQCMTHTDGSFASMGPQAFARGSCGMWGMGYRGPRASMGPQARTLDRPCQVSYVSRASRFNGAAGFRPRKSHYLITTIRITNSFNGAAGFRPRKSHNILTIPDCQNRRHSHALMATQVGKPDQQI